jgi:hypothetical protein
MGHHSCFKVRDTTHENGNRSVPPSRRGWELGGRDSIRAGGSIGSPGGSPSQNRARSSSCRIVKESLRVPDGRRSPHNPHRLPWVCFAHAKKSWLTHLPTGPRIQYPDVRPLGQCSARSVPLGVAFGPIGAISKKARPKKPGKTINEGAKSGGKWRFSKGQSAIFAVLGTDGRRLQAANLPELRSLNSGCLQPPSLRQTDNRAPFLIGPLSVVRGHWCVVLGPWSVIIGPLSVVRGPLSVAGIAPALVGRCPWSVVLGPLQASRRPWRAVVHGPWSLVRCALRAGRGGPVSLVLCPLLTSRRPRRGRYPWFFVLGPLSVVRSWHRAGLGGPLSLVLCPWSVVRFAVDRGWPTKQPFCNGQRTTDHGQKCASTDQSSCQGKFARSARQMPHEAHRA